MDEAMYRSLSEFAEKRMKAVEVGMESKELAALLVEKFAEGMKSCGQDVSQLADQLCEFIDPAFRQNRILRMHGIASLFVEDKKVMKKDIYPAAIVN